MAAVPEDSPRRTRTPLGLFAAAIALLLPVAFSPVVAAPFWSPKLFVALVLAAVGLVLLVRLALRRSAPAIAATAFVAIAGGAAVTSGEPALSLVGSYGWSASWVLVAAIAAAWALGRSQDDLDRSDLQNALLLAVAANVLMALLQQAIDLGEVGLEHEAGSHGLLGNPVHLGGFLAGSVALVEGRFRSRPWPWTAFAFAVGVALQFSGSRLGTAVALGVLLLLVVVRRQLRTLFLVGAVVAGIPAGVLLTEVLPDAAERRGVTEKLAGTQGLDLELRTSSWRASLEGFADHALLGYGPGRYVEAYAPNTPLELARAAPDTTYRDAHNLFVEYLLTTGILGCTAFAVFLVLAVRGASGPLLVFALAMLAVQMLQPQSFATTPVAFLALGAAHRDRLLPPLAAPRLAALALGTGALALGTVVLVGDFRLRQAELDFELHDGRTAASLLWAWPEPEFRLGLIHVFRAAGVTDERRAEHYGQSERAFGRGVRRDPAIASSWSNLANLELVRDKPNEAREHFRKALERNPWSVRALVGLAEIELSAGDQEEAVSYLRRASQVVGRETVEDLLRSREIVLERDSGAAPGAAPESD